MVDPALVVIGKARTYSQDVSDAQFRTTLILKSLTTWAQEVGLTQEPPTLLVNANDALLVPDILQKLEKLFTDIGELRQRYGSHLQQTDEDFDPQEDDGTVVLDTDTQRRRWVKRIDVTIFSKSKQPWKRLRWVTLDNEKFDRFLAKAKGYVNELVELLEQARRKSIAGQLEFFLRDTILKADDHRLGIIGKEYQQADANIAVSAAARLKQATLALDMFEPSADMLRKTPGKLAPSASFPLSSSSPPYNSQMPDLRLSMRLLTLSKAARSNRLRTLAQYDGQTVLLEWKYVNRMDDLAIARRVSQVATLLHEPRATLHSLQCRGYVKDLVAKRYGYIFDIPETVDRIPHSSHALKNEVSLQADSTIQLKSLRQMLGELPHPTLNTRLSFAVTLLETLLDLHTSGWLHKEIRSENILLIRQTPHDDNINQNDLSTYSVYIAGYVYSRLDSPGELTEPLESELEANIYRHPTLLSNTHQPYRKSFDIFSVGCTLLEIGLWTTLRQILEHHCNHRADTSRIMGRANPETLSHQKDKEVLRDADETNKPKSTRHSFDLMALRRDLLCSYISGPEKQSRLSSNELARNEIMNSLRAAMGRRYTAIVEDLLATGSQKADTSVDENESALDLEIMARNIVRSIADAV